MITCYVCIHFANIIIKTHREIIVQSHWSALIDILLDVHVNVKNLNAREVMGFIAFCALETNGTSLPVGILCSFLKSKKGCRALNKFISNNGMYYTLLSQSVRLSKSRHTSIYGSSVNPRHVGHNRSYNEDGRNPIAGVPENFGGYDPTSKQPNEDKAMKAHCARIEKDLINLCANTTNSFLNKNQESEGTTANEDAGKDKKKKNDSLNVFLDEIKKIAGKGCSAMYSLNFVQLAGYFGFVPIKILATSTVENKGSGGYKFIELLYGGLSLTDAQRYFKESVEMIQGIFGKSSFTFAIAENMLCELYRDREGKNKKKDVTFFFDHRNNKWGGLQNFFRLKVNSGMSMNLEMLGISVSNKTREKGCIKLMSWINGLTAQKCLMKWIHSSTDDKIQSTIGYKSELFLSPSISRYYTMLHSPNGKRKRTEIE